MFDDLRSKSVSPFEEDVPLDEPLASQPTIQARQRTRPEGEMRILGMTASQRLVLSIMLFLDVAVLGCFLLLATGAVVPPF